MGSASSKHHKQKKHSAQQHQPQALSANPTVFPLNPTPHMQTVGGFPVTKDKSVFVHTPSGYHPALQPMPTPTPQPEAVIPDQMGHKKSNSKHGILKQYGYPPADSSNHPDPANPYSAAPYGVTPIVAPSAFPPPPIIGEPPVFASRRGRAATPFVRPASVASSSSSDSTSSDDSSSSSSSGSSDRDHRSHYRAPSASSYVIPPMPSRTPSAPISMPQPSVTPHIPPPPPPAINMPQPPPPVIPDPGNAVRPMSPAHPSAYGPSVSTERRPLRNPLPPPPRDVYDLTPFKSIREMSETTNFILRGQGIALKSGHVTVPDTIVPGILNQTHDLGKKEEKKKGLFKTLGSLGKKGHPEPRVVPVYVPAPEPPRAHSRQSAHSRSASTPIHIPPPPPTSVPNISAASPMPFAITQTPLANSAPVRPPSRSTSTQSQTTHRGGFDVEVPTHHGRRDSASGSQSSGSSMPIPVPPPVIPSSPASNIGRPAPLPIPFSHTTPYASFLNHSRHRVMFENQTYPTAIHLHEALRFLPDHPEIAEKIRESADPAEAYRASAWGQEKRLARSDWKRVWMEMMDKVLLLKFQQHPKLRAMLLNTGEAELIYADEDDAFWGRGPTGEGRNELGKALMRVRAQLLAVRNAQ